MLAHDHHLRAGQLLDERVSFLMIAVRVRAEQDLDVRELKAERGNRLLDRAHVALVGAVDQDVTFGIGDQKRAERPCADVVDVPTILCGGNAVVWSSSVPMLRARIERGV